MRLNTSVGSGEWFVFRREEKEVVEFQVRRIPALKAKEIEVRHLGRQRPRKISKGVTLIEYDVEKSERVIVEKASYALLDSRNVELPVEDLPAFPATGKVKDGYALLDGQWTDEVKAQAFATLPALAVWIVEKATSLEVTAQEDEEGKGQS